MLNISEYYSSAIKKEEKKWYMRVRFADSVNELSSAYIDLDDYDIIEDSTSITSSATSNSYFSIGGVCAKELSLTLTAYGVVKLKEKSALKKGVCLSVDLWTKTDDTNQSDVDYSKNIDDTENTTGKVKMGNSYIYSIQNQDFQCKTKAYDAILMFPVDIS